MMRGTIGLTIFAVSVAISAQESVCEKGLTLQQCLAEKATAMIECERLAAACRSYSPPYDDETAKVQQCLADTNIAYMTQWGRAVKLAAPDQKDRMAAMDRALREYRISLMTWTKACNDPRIGQRVMSDRVAAETRVLELATRMTMD